MTQRENLLGFLVSALVVYLSYIRDEPVFASWGAICTVFFAGKLVAYGRNKKTSTDS